MTIGERIKEIRNKMGMSQVDFADKINVSKQTLYKYENNIITNIPSDKIEAAAQLGNVTPSYLMGWESLSDEEINNVFHENTQMTLSKNIRFLRKKHEWSQDFVADKLGYKSYTTIQKWETGTSEPPLRKLKELADLFRVDMDDLTNKDLTSSEFKKSTEVTVRKGVEINVLGRVAAGIPIEAITDIIDTEEISEKLARTGEFFGLKIKGDSMAPDICNNDVVIVRQQNDAESGEIVIVTINGDEAMCKRLRKYKDGIELLSINPSYKPFEFSNKEILEKPIKIIGKVVESRRKF